MRFLLLVLLVGCGSDSKDVASTTSTVFTCEVPRKSYNGCCSSHDGFEDNCENAKGEVMFGSGGELVCRDGSLSPTCRR